jgi:flagellar hook-associated protein 2
MPAVTFGGVGSGIDTESIISGLLAASRGPLDAVNQQASQVKSAVSDMSDIGGLLSKLKDSLTSLDTVQEVGSFKVSSDNTAVAASATGNAQAGSFEIEVGNLATAYKAYSNTLGVSQPSQALNQAGTLSLSVGGKSADVSIAATDTLDQVMNKVNASGLRVSASAVFDGNQFRLQLRGLDTGTANDVTVTENGTSFGFASNVKSNGKDANFTVDGIAITSASNQVSGVINGVTLALGAKTTGPATVTIASDADSFQSKLQTMVNSYNSLITRIHSEAGFGSIKASNTELAGDSALRSVTDRLNNALTTTIGTGKFQTLGSIGIRLNNDGTLKLDTTKFQTALSSDPNAVTKILAGDDKSVKGVTDILADLASGMLDTKGVITTRQDALNARQKDLGDRADIEQKRLDQLETQLRTQFTQMDQLVSASKAQMNFLTAK